LFYFPEFSEKFRVPHGVTAEPALSPQAEKQAEKSGNMHAARICFSVYGSLCPAGSPIVSQSLKFCPALVSLSMTATTAEKQAEIKI
jgi:hypothetical protein